MPMDPEETLMFDKSPSIEIRCDAPPYSIVQACRIVGMRTPEDVRWCRLSQFRETYAQQLELFKPHTWKAMWSMPELDGSRCSCGQQMPRLEKITFTYLSGKAVD